MCGGGGENARDLCYRQKWFCNIKHNRLRGGGVTNLLSPHGWALSRDLLDKCPCYLPGVGGGSISIVEN